MKSGSIAVSLFLLAAGLSSASPANAPQSSASQSTPSQSSWPSPPPGKSWEVFVPKEYNYCLAAAPEPKKYKPVQDAELSFVQLIVRHGDRTNLNLIPHDDTVWDACSHDLDTNVYTEPTKPFPGKTGVKVQQRIFAPHGPKSFAFALYGGNCESGQLTDKGKEMHRDLGSRLRNIYVDELNFLPKDFTVNSIYLRSTSTWRTKQSAQSLLGGLYPEGHWPSHSYIQLHTLPDLEENMKPNRKSCLYVNGLRSEIEKEKTWTDFLASQDALWKKLYNITNLGVYPLFPDTDSWIGWMDTFQPRVCHNKPLPCTYNPKTNRRDLQPCVTREDADISLRNAFFHYIYQKRDSPNATKFVRLATGSFLNDLSIELKEVAKGGNSKSSKHDASKHRFSFYSGHDDTVSSLLGAFKADDKNMLWPPYRSNILVELWKKKNGKHIIRVIYNGEVLTLQPGHQWCNLEGCDLETFTNYLDSLVPQDLAKECRSM
ncbi:hypothetical protein H4219_000461 [Mycoemilia scoparia]|uniref:Acid phosphatase n=1 Tax=Mycoemilia scoparia TaxID=417184 RepID=A0A9W8A8G8_9FUNG|nr:hypothetical protein H4219_000461 [Mycoemilia scoparia]